MNRELGESTGSRVVTRTPEGLARLWSEVRPHHTDPGTIGEYVALQFWVSSDAAIRAFPNVASHLAEPCPYCAEVAKDVGDYLHGDIVERQGAPAPADPITNQLLKGQGEGGPDSLNGRERRVLRLRLGLEDGRQWTPEEIAREFGLIPAWVRHIEAKARRKLRYASRMGRPGSSLGSDASDRAASELDTD